jgi:hypothetical protein
MLILCEEDGDELGRGGEGLILLDDEINLIPQLDGLILGADHLLLALTRSRIYGFNDVK